MMLRLFVAVLVVIFVVLISARPSFAQSTGFVYQGSLRSGASHANGNYDLEFKLFDALTAGSQLGSTVTALNVAVINGIFAAQLDFGNQFSGANRYMEIGVRSAGGGNFQQLLPRQQIASNPYGIRSLTAANADNALNLGGVAANQYVLTTDPRLSDPRDPLPGSASYIQNRTSTQALSNFNISGTGTADVFDAGTQFNIAGFRVFSAPGTGLSNTFAGYRSGNLNLTGTQNTSVGYLSGESLTAGSGNSLFGMGTGPFLSTGNANTFVGTQAGYSTTTGGSNTFAGANAGYFNVDGSTNAYFGHSAGRNNSSSGNSFFGAFAGEDTTTGLNTFIGESAGIGNTTGTSNTAIGQNSGFTGNNLSFATAIGAGSRASSNNSITLGRANGADDVIVPGALSVAGVMTALSNFNVSGNSVVGGTITASTVNFTSGINFNGAAFARASIDNTFVGRQAGGTSNTGTRNSFFGSLAGTSNTTGGSNSMFGMQAGFSNTSGSENAFFGDYAGSANTTASHNSFFGASSGFRNTTGSFNSFFGDGSGAFNTTGQDNAFFGNSAGVLNNIGGNNSAFGTASGTANTTGGQNSFFGYLAGASNTLENGNTFIGAYSNGVAGITNSTAIGTRALVQSPNSLVLGSVAGQNGALTTANVGIGTVAPASRLHVVGNSLLNGNLNVIGSSTLSTVSIAGGLTAFGNVGMGTSAPTEQLHVVGNARVTGNVTADGNVFGAGLYVSGLGTDGNVPVCLNTTSERLSTCSSSLRYKTNVADFRAGLDLINRLRPIAFDWKKNGTHDIGFAAEEVAAIDPRFIIHNDKGEVEGVKYDRIGVVLVNALKEQQAEIDELRKQLDEQKALTRELIRFVCEQNRAAAPCGK